MSSLTPDTSDILLNHEDRIAEIERLLRARVTPVVEPGNASALMGTTVVAETSYGLSPLVGTGTRASREDHTHGSPPASVVETSLLISTYVLNTFTVTYMTVGIFVPAGAAGLVVHSNLSFFVDNGEDCRGHFRTLDPTLTFFDFPDEMRDDPPNVGDFRGTREKTWAIKNPIAGFWVGEVQPYKTASAGGTSAVVQGRLVAEAIL